MLQDTPQSTPADAFTPVADALRREALLRSEDLPLEAVRGHIASHIEGTADALLEVSSHLVEGDTLEDAALIADLLGLAQEA